ncbi:hypothetical protein KBA27_01415 [bacterium]|nr:hypothetical protein [bacterium]
MEETQEEKSKQEIEKITLQGDVQYVNGDYNNAILTYRQVMILEPLNWGIYTKIGKCFKELKEFDTAIEFFNHTIELNPEYPFAYSYIGEIYANEKGDVKKGIEYFKKHVELEPDNFLVVNMLGHLYSKLDLYGTLDLQRKCFEKSLEIKPDFDIAIRNLAFTYSRLGRDDLSIKFFRKVLKSKEVWADDEFAFACLLIKHGFFKEGWKLFESRFNKKFGKTLYITSDKPRWYGEKIENKTLLIQYEQGFGDTFQFSRFIPLVKKLVGKIIFRVQDETLELIKRNFPDIQVVGESTAIEDLEFDYHTPLMSLPMVLDIKMSDLITCEQRFEADNKKVKFFKNKYFNNKDFKIGISWNGAVGGNYKRDIPVFEFLPLTKLKGVKVYSFQKGGLLNLTDEYAKSNNITIVSRDFKDFDYTASAMKNLDMFITSDNGIFNLAATMGVPTYMLMNKESEWRWFFDETTTPWYSDVRLFKKDFEQQPWNCVMERALNALNKKLLSLNK